MQSEQRKDWGLTVLRVVIGIVFLVHGSQKLFVFGFGGVQAAFASLGLPMPAILGPLVTLLEFAGGIALIAGLLTQWVAMLFAIQMAVAVIRVHLAGGFFLPRGYEFALTMFGASIALALAGPGAAAVDRVLFKRSA
jgi:putative oxidoreductase